MLTLGLCVQTGKPGIFDQKGKLHQPRFSLPFCVCTCETSHVNVHTWSATAQDADWRVGLMVSEVIGRNESKLMEVEAC